MNKSVTRVACLLLSAMTAFSLVSCKDGGGSGSTGGTKYNRDTRPLVMATEALDGNFNPFFATSATDSNMASITQLGMLTTDEKGNIVCGQDEPTVALSYKITEEKTGDTIDYTNYEFIIKNGIKFSDGKALTINDVLFNLYVYLDPAYMGSATMYSTDIVGLKSYRAQKEMDDDSSDDSLSSLFTTKANQRRRDILNYLDDDYNGSFTAEVKEQIEKDLELIKKEFKEEITSDWTASSGAMEGYEDEYAFEEPWQIYYFNEGLIYVESVQGKPLRDENNKYVTNITPAGTILKDGTAYAPQGVPPTFTQDIEAAKNDEEAIAKYMATGATREEAQEAAIKEHAINTVYDAYTGSDDKLSEVLRYWATGSTVYEKFVGDAKTEYYEELKQGGELPFKTITGITTETVQNDFDGKALGADHSKLKIRIKGVDPKAIYNFSFAVAPLHYYANGDHKGTNYAQAANGVDNFGVAFGDSSFFENILQADEKNKKPVGAGSYQVSNRDGEIGDAVAGNEFYANNHVYFARNEYFNTVGTGIKNANIKYLRYKVVNSDKLVESLTGKDIDVGEPNAKPENIAKIDATNHLAQKTVDVNGYGYVGINPKHVPHLEVRQAIMKAMDPYYCLSYYTSEYASVIYRSMSTQSWIWQHQDLPETRPDDLEIANSPSEIESFLSGKGWKKGANGIFAKDGETLQYTFTIAGATTDHPAYVMFSKAAETLNQAGFDVKVMTDISALKKLATGQLQVWAAAWSSTIDPDMYQVYHKDSNATSTKNWGYDAIKEDSVKYATEAYIIDELSVIIDEARNYNDQGTRAALYVQALDLVMDLAVELPTYQRKDCVAYNKEVINPASLNQSPTAFAGVIDKIWEVDYN